MRIWFDAVTSKEPLLFDAIAKELEKQGHEMIFTCRDYDYVVSLFDLLGRKVEVKGKHGGGTLYGKLIAGTERIKSLANYINNLSSPPDYHISFGCPESTRVAFGLAIPSININDSPHATAVAKLTIPLSKYLIYSQCIDKEKWLKLGTREKQLLPYDGIDEVAWLKDFEPKSDVLKYLGLSKEDHFIVGRPEESSAAYMLEKKMIGETYLDLILDDIFEYYNGKAVIFPRYTTQKEKLEKKYGNRIIIPKKAVDTLSLNYYADLCITGGATMAREAAAIGSPGISYYPKPLDVLVYIASTGIPLFNEYELNGAKERVRTILQDNFDKRKMRKKTKKILQGLQSPIKPIKEILCK